MTLEERKRAKKLERLSQAYVKSMPQKICIPIMLAIMAVIYSIMFATGGGEGVPAIHTVISGILLLAYSNGITGDRDTGIDTRIHGTQISGTMYTGPFLCTLPFKAKDMLALRIREFEINIAAINIPAAVIHIILMLTGGSSGFCAALIPLMEVGFLILIFVRRFNKLSLFYLEMLIFIVAMTLAIASISLEEAEEGIYTDFEFLSGMPGIAAIMISHILILAAGELFLKNKKSVSWNLR